MGHDKRCHQELQNVEFGKLGNFLREINVGQTELTFNKNMKEFSELNL